MNRLVLAAVAVMAVTLPVRARAQDQSYATKRAELIKQLEASQKALDQLKGQRLQFAAHIEDILAEVAEARAQTLLLSNEQASLHQIDSLLIGAQDNLASQRDRLTALGNAVRDRSGAVLVVLFRADSSGGTTVQGATLAVDGGNTATRTYSDVANGALRAGAVDEVFRGSVLPAAHTVVLQVNANGGQPLTQTASVTASGQTVTYVQFALRNGQLVATTWSTRGTTPF